MSDLYFFKRIRGKQWLGLRLPANLHFDFDADGRLTPPATPAYVGASALPAWVGTPRMLVLQVENGVDKSVLAEASGGTRADWQPFQRSRAALANPEMPANRADAGDLAAAMAKAAGDPLLPLRMYQAYRDFPARPAEKTPLLGDAIRLALAGALGGTADACPLEAYSELLFITDEVDEPPEPAQEIDGGSEAPARLRVSADQSAAGVTLQLALEDGRGVTNGNLVATIHGPGAEPKFAPFYRWRRTLGVAERPSADSGAVLIPADVASLRAGAAGGPAWAERPFRVVDRLGAQQLAGELLNYELRLFNPHGRCTHAGRVMLRRQRLDPPAPPLGAVAELLPPDAGGAPARCTVTYHLAAGQAEPTPLEPVLYRQDYPVVPTGFYGDDDDAALSVARSLGEPGGEPFAPGQLADDGADGMPLPNLSSHNLQPVDLAGAVLGARMADGQEERRIELALALRDGHATRLFLALRRRVEGAPAPESQVATLEHRTGPDEQGLRAVPHFECFWRPLPARAWLGEGAARVMVIEDRPAAPDAERRPAALRVVIQHARPDAPAGADLPGGYRLWMRDVAATGDPTPFTAVALVQAVPPLVKLYAPLELGRAWNVDAAAVSAPRAAPAVPAALPARDFILLDGARQEPGAAPGAPPQGAATLSDLMRNLGQRDDDAALVLAMLQKARAAGTAREVVLSLGKRRALQRTRERPPGNWVFFHDQAGNLLGRAVQFWFADGHGVAEAELPRAEYRLVEVPGAQDTVALDDFGRAAWRWHGLGDLWRHELEWMIEAVPRYAPIQGQRARLGPEEAGMVTALRAGGAAPWHHLAVPRRAPFKARFGLRQVLDAADDAFVIDLDAPHAFRQSLYNSVARTRQGVLRMHAAPAVRRFRFAEEYAGVDDALLTAWLDGQQGDARGEPPRMAFGLPAGTPAGTYGQLVYDEPPCLALTVRVGASADDVYSQDIAEIGPLVRRRTHTLPAPPPLVVDKGVGKMRIDVPLARLDWFYGGAVRPAIAAVDTGGKLQEHGGSSLLRLPDPEAELRLYFTFDGQPEGLVAHFRGSALGKADWEPGPDFGDVLDLKWGYIRTALGMTGDIAGGDLRIHLTAVGLPTQVRARWHCGGRELVMAWP